MVGGYVDVICFIRYSTFVATMTGNLVITGQTFFEVIHTLTVSKEHTFRPSPEPIKTHLEWDVALTLVLFRSMVMFFNCIGSMIYCWLQRRIPVGTARAAAPWVAMGAMLPDVVSSRLFGHHHDAWYAQLSVATLAMSLGFVHFMCSPAAEGSRLKAVTMAATGHMHGMTKANFRLLSGESLKPAEWDKYVVSLAITLGMAFGAAFGAAALHLNPIGADTNDWLLAPVAFTLFIALRAHDEHLPAPKPAAPPVAPAESTGLAALQQPLAPNGGRTLV